MTSLDLTFSGGGLSTPAPGTYDLMMGTHLTPFTHFVYNVGGFSGPGGVSIFYGAGLTTSTSTSSQDLVFIEPIGGGVGLIGIENPTPDLRAAIQGVPEVTPFQSLPATLRALQSDSTEPLSTTIVEGLGGGVGIVVSTNKPDLSASILPEAAPIFEEALLNSKIIGVISTSTQPLTFTYVDVPGGGLGIIASTATPDLTATIAPSLFFQGQEDLYGYIIPTSTSGNALKAAYRSAEAGEATISGYIDGFDEDFLTGFYRPTFSGEQGGLTGLLEAIPPLDLLAELIGVTGTELFADIEPVAPESLFALISGLSFLDLTASIDGVDSLTLDATISGNYIEDLTAFFLGVGSGTQDLLASYQGYRGIEESKQLRATLTLSEDISISGTVEGFRPETISGTIEPVPPVDLFAEWEAKDPPVDLDATVTGIFADGSLFAEIEAAGGVEGLTGYITSATAGTLELLGVLEGIATHDLKAEYGTAPQDLLGAMLTATGINNLGLNAAIRPTQSVTLSGVYEFSPSLPIIANIEAIEASKLYAEITPKVFYVDSSIPINTFPYKSLKAQINAAACSFSSFYNDLGVYIKGIDSKDLEASIVGIAGQYAISQDYLSILSNASVISEDWVFIIAEQSIISESSLPLVIATSPFSDLRASIEGLQPEATITGSITPIFYSEVRSDNTVIGQWVNTKTGQRKTIRIFFRGDSDEFYYSTDANKSFTVSPSTTLEIVIETYELIEETESTLLTQKTAVKRCVVDNLNDFNTMDEAIRYGIMCALSEINQELRAYIIASGGYKDLGAEIFPIDTDFLKDLSAKYVSVTNQPELFATISGTGDLSDLSGFIRASSTSFTTSEITDTLGTRYVPKLVVHGNGEYSVVLTKVTSTDIIDLSQRPDLSADIVGISSESLSATVSGSI